MSSSLSRFATYAILALALILSLWVMLAPEVSRDEMALPTLRYVRGDFFSWLIPVLILAFVLSVIVAVAFVPFSQSLLKREGWGGAWAEWFGRLVFVVIPSVVLLYALVHFALSATAPSSEKRNLVAIEGVSIDDSYSASLTSAIKLDETSRVAGSYILASNKLWKLGVLPELQLHSRAGGISDFAVRGQHLFVIDGTKLLSVDTYDWTATLIANLPVAGLRFGQIKRSFGSASNFLLWGSDGEKSFVYEMRSDGHYAKLADLSEKIAGCAACIDRTYVATSTRVIQLRLGFKPTEVFRVPEGDKVKSILARQNALDDRDQCILLIATADAVYSLQNGIAVLLIAGMGGNLGASEDSNLNFTLVDYGRGAAVGVSFDP